MPQTPEQKAANNALTDAINACVEAYGFRDGTMVNTNYMVIVEQTGFDDDGDMSSGIVRLSKDGDMPWTSILGLLRCATLAAERAYSRDGTDSTDD